jgi:hypothetical protein
MYTYNTRFTDRHNLSYNSKFSVKKLLGWIVLIIGTGENPKVASGDEKSRPLLPATMLEKDPQKSIRILTQR